MKLLAEIAIVMTMGTITVNGLAVKAEDILDSAKEVTNAANIHQLETALELYYLDHQHYPDTGNGAQMIETLKKEDYIQNEPLDPNVFHYQAIHEGNDYTLVLE